jgi:hypothetical protein
MSQARRKAVFGSTADLACGNRAPEGAKDRDEPMGLSHTPDLNKTGGRGTTVLPAAAAPTRFRRRKSGQIAIFEQD